MHATIKSLRDACRLSWFKSGPAISGALPDAARDHQRPNARSAATADPGQFIIQFASRISALNRLDTIGETERRRRLGMLLDETFDLKIIGDFLLGTTELTRSSQERQDFDRHLRNYLIESIRVRGGCLSPRRLRVIDHYQDGVATVVVTELNCGVLALYFDWILIAKMGNWRLCNLIIEDINLGALLQTKVAELSHPGDIQIIRIDNLLQRHLGSATTSLL